MAREIPREMLESFIVEAHTELESARSSLSSYRDSGKPAFENEHLAEARRITHRLKGEASMIGLSDFSHVAYFQEELLEEAAADPVGTNTHPIFGAIEQTQTALEQFLRDVLDTETDEIATLVVAVKAYRRFRALPESQDEKFIEQLFVKRSHLPIGIESLPPVEEDAMPADESPSEGDHLASPKTSMLPSTDTLHLDAFRQEVSDHLQILTDLLTSEEGIEGEEFHQVRRSIHSVKGGASAIGLQEVADLSHVMEDVVETLCRSEVEFSPYLRDLLIHAVDTLDELVEKGKTRTNLEQLCRLLSEASEANTMAWSRPRDQRPISEQIQIIDDELAPVEGFEAQDDVDDQAGIPPTANTVTLDETPLAETPVAPPETNSSPASTTVDAPIDDLPVGRTPVNDPALDEASREARAAVEADLDNIVPPELYEVFREEAEDHVKLLYSGLNALQTDAKDREQLQAVRRSAHTLKGAAGAVGLRVVTKLSHRMEDLLDYLYDNDRPLTPSILTLLLNTTDRLHDLAFDDLGDEQKKSEITNSIVQLYAEYGVLLQAGATATQAPATPESISITTQALPTIDPDFVNESETNAASPAKSAKASTPRSESESRKSNQLLRVPLERVDDLVRTVSELIINRTTFEQRMSDFVRYVDELTPVLSRLRHVSTEMETKYSVDALREDRSALRNRVVSEFAKSQINEDRLEEFDSLEFDRYNEFHLLARSVSEATNDVNTITNELRTLIGDFDSLLLRQDRLSRDTQDRLMRVRMVPMATLATRLHRAVRVVASNQSKQVELVIEGEDTELDKTVLEEIADPLLHLLRNAVDHGVEPSDLRIIRGKAEKATIRIRAFYQGTQAVLRISDDGAGLDPKRIADAAIRRGYLSESDAEGMSPQEIFPFIFIPGLTTAAKLSEVSGRGVGMDIVRDAVQRLKGTITVDSEPDRGTTFTIRLPLTLAVTRSLMVVSGNELFALPMQSVVQIARIERDRVEQLGDDPVIRLNGTACPLIKLSDHLGLRDADENSATIPILIVRSGERQVAVRVERIVAGKDIVVKTLGSHLRRVNGLVGATLLGDGTVVPILDPNSFASFDGTAVPVATAARSQASDATTTVMIVDDSVSVRRVMENLVKSQGWIPIVAKDGVDALEILQSVDQTPDIFLLDIEMPRMDGYELLSTLRGMARCESTPIVMVTSRAGEKHRQKAFSQGASDYLVKPYQDEQLIGLVQRLTSAAQESSLV